MVKSAFDTGDISQDTGVMRAFMVDSKIFGEATPDPGTVGAGAVVVAVALVFPNGA